MNDPLTAAGPPWTPPTSPSDPRPLRTPTGNGRSAGRRRLLEHSTSNRSLLRGWAVLESPSQVTDCVAAGVYVLLSGVERLPHLVEFVVVEFVEF
ncbi:MAG: hypothetical protein ACRDQW_16850 [Haloechinothrix sp.]